MSLNSIAQVQEGGPKFICANALSYLLLVGSQDLHGQKSGVNSAGLCSVLRISPGLMPENTSRRGETYDNVRLNRVGVGEA